MLGRLKRVRRELQKYANKDDAVFLQRFFKTGPGEYGEDDVFIGVRMPAIRKVAHSFKDLTIGEVEDLLDSDIHEERMLAVIIMTNKCKQAKTTITQKKALFDLYLKRTDRINNWDIVDVSCRDIVGGYLIDKPKDILYKLAKSQNLWERRIAIVSTWFFIKNNELDETLAIAEQLTDDSHDLIHKAVGWMLREVGKRNEDVLHKYLQQHAKHMPRTTLRYAIERLSSLDRRYYMQLKG